MKKIICLFLSIFVLCLYMTGCTKLTTTSGSSKAIKITDDNQRLVTLKMVPQRIVVLSPSFLELVQAVDGKVVGRAKTQLGSIPDFAKEAAEVGYIFNINIERVVELKPDVVIAYKGMHERYLHTLESNNIPVIVLSLKSYDDVKHSLLILGQMMRNEAKGKAVADKLDNDIKATVSRLPKSERTVAILHTTNMGITLEKESSIAGCCAKLLHLKNIVQGTTKAVSGPMGTQPDMAPYSLEDLLEKNPQVIFITSMGEKKDIEGKLKSELMNNEAWYAIDAVKNKQVFYLPDELFLLNPGLRYPEAVRLMAEKLQPELVKEKSNG